MRLNDSIQPLFEDVPEKYGTKFFRTSIILHLQSYAAASNGLFHGNVLTLNAAVGNWKIIRWLDEIGCRPNLTTILTAARAGNLKLVKRFATIRSLHGEGFLGVETFIAAANGGHIDVVRWLVQKGCYWDVTGMLLGCYWDVTGMLLGCYWDVTGMLLGCYWDVTGMLLGCYWDVTGMLLGCYWDVTGMLLGCYWDVTGMLLGCYWDVTGMLLGCYWDVTGMLLGCYWDVTGMLLGCKGDRSSNIQPPLEIGEMAGPNYSIKLFDKIIR